MNAQGEQFDWNRRNGNEGCGSSHASSVLSDPEDVDITCRTPVGWTTIRMAAIDGTSMKLSTCLSSPHTTAGLETR